MGDAESLLQVTGCSAELQRPRCDSGCLSERYRSITGKCNNRSVHTHTHTHGSVWCFPEASCLFRQHSRWGAANTPYSRWLPPEYEDAWGAPRGWDPEHTYHNFTLPPVRARRSPLPTQGCSAPSGDPPAAALLCAGAAGLSGAVVHSQ